MSHSLYEHVITASTPQAAQITEQIPAEITPDEKAAITYVGGYIARKVIKKSSMEKNRPIEMIYCMPCFTYWRILNNQ